MALPAKRVPESVAHLDVEIVAAALIRHDANVRNAARALGVPSGDLRKLVLVDQRLADAALEAVELRLDDAEANLSEALHCDDPRRRDAVSMFMLRNTQRASKRGYAVAASAASLEVNIEPARPVTTSSSGASRTTESRTASLILANIGATGGYFRRRGTVLAATSAMMTALSMASFRRGYADRACGGGGHRGDRARASFAANSNARPHRLLRLRPDKADAFDAKFGVGAAAKILGR